MTLNTTLDKKDIKENDSKDDPEEATKDLILNDISKSVLAKGDDVSVGEILDQIVLNALRSKASDIHIEPREKDVLVRYRVDGILRDVYVIDKKFEQALIFKIKVNAKLRTDEHFAPQDGRIRFDLDERLDTRISILPTTKGEKVVIRLLAQQGKSFNLEDLGLRDKDLEKVKKGYLKPYGSIFAAGPTGSGKTTSLYAILQTVNSRDINITTVEDPVEYEIEGVNQIHINPKAGLTFEKGLRSILRQDPDVIMIGEIRDSETAKIAINAAMTGHLVLSTIHTNDSITTIPRLIDMGVDPYLVASTLNIVIAQRLGRRLCENCKKERTIPEDEYKELKKFRPDIAALVTMSDRIYKEIGCPQCGGTGFKGRTGLYEVLEITEQIRKIIMINHNSDDIYSTARKEGLILIVEDGVSKLKEGLLSLSELIRVTALKE